MEWTDFLHADTNLVKSKVNNFLGVYVVKNWFKYGQHLG